MLTPSGHEQTPAAAVRCRCSFVWASSFAAIALLAVMACSAPPPDPAEWDGVREALARAVRELRSVDAADAQEIERLIADAERVSAAERAAPPWRRDHGRAAAAWNRAAFQARQSVASARALRRSQEQRLELLLASAEPRIAAAAARIGRSGMRGREAGQVAAARTHIATARRLAAHHEFAAALGQAELALALATELDASWLRNHERFSDPALLTLWRGQAQATIDESRRRGTSAIVIDKLRRRVVLYRGGHVVARFDAEFGGAGLERKLRSGDRATPEGRYRVAVKKSGSATKYYLALLIDYPNSEDQRRYRQAIADGSIPRSTGIGGLIEIHGGGGTGRDWTDGCVALTNEDMDRLFPQVQVGTPVTIVGTL
jgi:hypothetical protein